MKPVSVRFQCFGPYMAEQYIDFRELERNGLFLICGETGAGKTTILDAMCYALYGSSSGGLRGDIEVMRCKLAEKTDETFVEFEFDSGGNRYKFTRLLKYKTKNLHKYHKCFLWNGEEYELITDKEKAINAQTERLVGLTCAQFRQVIILPQGQFEQFLVADSAQKETILVSLFNADQWQNIAKELSRRVQERDEALKAEKQRITARLQSHGCDSLDALTEKRGALEAELSLLRTQAQELDRNVEAQHRAYQAALLDDQAFRELRKRETGWKLLKDQTAHFQVEETLLHTADAAARIHPQFQAWQEGEKALGQAQIRKNQQEKSLITAQRALEKAQADRKAHEEGAQSEGERRRELAKLENAREVYGSLTDKRTAVAEREHVHRQAQLAADTALQAFREQEEGLQEAMERQNAAIEEYKTAQSAYLRGIGGTLAERLLSGKPCPVCGSLDHPAPAQKAEEHVSESQLEKLNRAMEQAGRQVSKTMTSRTKAEKLKNEAEETLHRASRELAVAVQDRDNAEARKIPGIETLTQLELRLETLRKASEQYEQTGERLRKALADAEGSLKAAQTALADAQTQLEAAETEAKKAENAWETVLSGSGLESLARFQAADLAPEEKQRRMEALVTYRTRLEKAEQELAEQRAALAGRTQPALAALEKGLREAETAQKQAASRLVLDSARLDTMAADEKKLTAQLAEYEVKRERVNGDLEFARRLLGSAGVGLQRYVLSVMMNSITAAANRLLANVYGGRYRLYRTDEIAGSGRKGGLELEVYDSHNNQRRSVTTLSGGEKFLVALSLAIGLSTVVQAQGEGIRLEAMFIDEGFGSLDRDAVSDALEILQGIQRSAGVVGIISHVEALAEAIPTRVEIRKGKNGSTCRILG